MGVPISRARQAFAHGPVQGGSGLYALYLALKSEKLQAEITASCTAARAARTRSEPAASGIRAGAAESACRPCPAR